MNASLRRASPARGRAMTRPAPPLGKKTGDDMRISPQPHSHLKPSLTHSVPRRGLSQVEALSTLEFLHRNSMNYVRTAVSAPHV